MIIIRSHISQRRRLFSRARLVQDEGDEYQNVDEYVDEDEDEHKWSSFDELSSNEAVDDDLNGCCCGAPFPAATISFFRLGVD